MNAKEYLSQAGKIQKRIECLSEQLRFMREAAENVSSVISDMPRSPNRNIHRTENAVIRIVDLEDKLKTELDKLAMVNELISRLSDPEEQEVLIKRYLNGQRWDEIVSDIDLSSRKVYQIHESALLHIGDFLCDVTGVSKMQ